MAERRVGIYLLLIGCLLAGLVTGRPFFLNLTYLFAALLAASWLWSRIATFSVRIGRRTTTRTTQVGRSFDEQFTVYNTGLLPKLWLEVRDHSTLPNHRASRVAPTLWPRARYSWTTQTVCGIRGQFTLGPMTIIGGDPFGFFQSKRQLPATASILVYPATVLIESFGGVAGELSGGDSDRRRTHFVTTNAAGIRDYMPGDSLNRIHWRSSARRDRLLVKEFEIDPQGDVWLWLDLSAATLAVRADPDSGYALAAPGSNAYLLPSSEEYAVTVAASLAHYFLTSDRALGFVSYCPGRVVMPPDRGLRQLARIMETLAAASSNGSVPLAQTLALEGHLPGRGATAVVITADMSPAWGAEAYGLARRGLRVVVVLLDPASFGGTGRVEDQAVRLSLAGISSQIVRYGDNLTAVLSG